MKTDKLYLFLIPTIILGLILISYAVGNTASESNQSDPKTQAVEEVDSINTENSTTEVKEEAPSAVKVTQTLSVDPDRCRGCGKCAMIDPEHFKMNGGLSVVISQQNLESSALNSAINSCRDNAISLG